MALLETSGLRAAYGGTTVLWGMDLAIPVGTIFCLLGRNGAGKTTLAHAITGLLPCAGGTVTFRGQDITSRSPEGRAGLGMALVPQGRRVFPDLTVSENLQVARFAAGARARPDTLPLVRDLFPPLSALWDRFAGTLSGGEQQMLAIARALVAEPILLVLDEPSLGLAPRVVEDMYVAIRRMKQERELTMLLIEQQIGGAISVADRVAVLDDGRVMSDIAAADLTDLSAIIDAYLGDRPHAGTRGRDDR